MMRYFWNRLARLSSILLMMLFLLIPYLTYVDPVEPTYFLFGLLVVQSRYLGYGTSQLVVVHQYSVVQVQGDPFGCQGVEDLRLILHAILQHHGDAVDLLAGLVLFYE